MKQPHIISSVFIIIITIIFFSCKKDHECQPGEKINFPEGDPDTSFILWDYAKSFIFQVGTFWVYQNDSTGEKDSTIVENTFHDFYYRRYSGSSRGEYVEFVRITIKAPITLQQYYLYIQSGLITHSINNRIPSFSDYSMPGQPVLNAVNIGSEYKGLLINSKVDSMFVNNYWHKDIVETKIIANKQEETFYNEDTYLFFAKNLGIIKKRTEPKSWSLKNWNIVY